jgi:hypothetical protein
MGFLRRLFGGSSEQPAKQPVATEIPERERRDLRSTSLPAGHRHLIQGPPLDVVGESQYRGAIENAVGRRAEGHQDIVDAAMVWEPSNRYDANAVAIQIEGRTCGYLPRADAKRYRAVMEWCRAEGFVPVVRGDVHGGWRQEDGSWADFGIHLYVASPSKLLGRSMPAPSSDHPWAGFLIAFTGDSRYAINGDKLDRETSEELARRAGMEVHPRVTKKVQLLVDCDPDGVSGNQAKAIEYGVPVVSEREFWEALRMPVESLA